MNILLCGGTGTIAHYCLKHYVSENSLFVLTSHPEKVLIHENLQVFPCDFNNPEDTLKTLDKILLRHNIGAIISISGINNGETFEKVTSKGVQETFLINALVPFLIIQRVASYWRCSQQEGNIIIISSIKAFEASANPSYGASKAALEHFCKTIAKNCGSFLKINTIALSPLIETANTMTSEKKTSYLSKIARKRFCKDQDFLNLIDFLLKENTYINGQTIRCDGGYNL